MLRKTIFKEMYSKVNSLFTNGKEIILEPMVLSKSLDNNGIFIDLYTVNSKEKFISLMLDKRGINIELYSDGNQIEIADIGIDNKGLKWSYSKLFIDKQPTEKEIENLICDIAYMINNSIINHNGKPKLSNKVIQALLDGKVSINNCINDKIAKFIQETYWNDIRRLDEEPERNYFNHRINDEIQYKVKDFIRKELKNNSYATNVLGVKDIDISIKISFKN